MCQPPIATLVGVKIDQSEACLCRKPHLGQRTGQRRGSISRWERQRRRYATDGLEGGGGRSSAQNTESDRNEPCRRALNELVQRQARSGGESLVTMIAGHRPEGARSLTPTGRRLDGTPDRGSLFSAIDAFANDGMVFDVGRKHPIQMALIEDDDVVQKHSRRIEPITRST